MNNENNLQQQNQVSVGQKSSGKAKIIVPIILCAVVALLVVAGVVLRIATASPKAVFKNTINNGYKYINNALDESEEYYDMFDIQKDAITISADVKANIETKDGEEWEKDLKDIKFSGKAGFDISNKEILVDGEMAGTKEKVNLKVFVQDKDLYLETNLIDKPVKLSSNEIEDELDIDWDEISDTLEEITSEVDTNPATYKEITKSIKNALIDSLDSEYMEKSKDEIEVNGKDIKVTKYSYELKEKAVKGIVENMADYLLDDSDFISNTAKAIGKDKSDIKDFLKDLKKSAKDINIDKDDIVTINVYTSGLLNKFAGLGIEYDGEEVMKYTTDGKNKEIVYSEGDDKVVVTVDAKGKDSYTVKVKYNKEQVAKIDVKEYNKEKIDLEYEIEIEETKVSGSVYLTQEKTKSKVSGDYKFALKLEDESYEIEGSYAIESSKKLDGIDTKSAVSEKDIDETKIKNKYEEIKKNDPTLGKILDYIFDEVEGNTPVTPVTPVTPTTQEPIKDYYGFYTVGYDTGAVKALLTKTEPTVVYVGSEYYSGDQAKTFESLKALHSEMHFTSYYFPYYRVDTENDYKTATTGINPQCNNSAGKCEEYPVILLVKDGKVQQMLKGNYDKENLKKVLTGFGLN